MTIDNNNTCVIDPEMYCAAEDCKCCPLEFDLVKISAEPISKGRVKVKIRNIKEAESLEKEGE
jgi:hypothetical protein